MSNHASLQWIVAGHVFSCDACCRGSSKLSQAARDISEPPSVLRRKQILQCREESRQLDECERLKDSRQLKQVQDHVSCSPGACMATYAANKDELSCVDDIADYG